MISLRLPEALLERIKILANKNDVPSQSLIKILLSEKVNEEFKKEITAADYKAATIDAAMDFEMRTIKIYSSRAK